MYWIGGQFVNLAMVNSKWTRAHVERMCGGCGGGDDVDNNNNYNNNACPRASTHMQPQVGRQSSARLPSS